MRSFALGELGWTLVRYKSSTIYEFNEASKGYGRKWEKEVWHTRELIWTIIQWAPFFKAEDKPKAKSDIYRLSIDDVKAKPVKKKKKPEISAEDLKIFQSMQFNKK